MVKCNLDGPALEEMQLLFRKINQAQTEILAGLTAHEDYAELINKINCLYLEDSACGEDLCCQALAQLILIETAEMAQFNLTICQEELARKYGIPSERGEESRGLDGR